MVAQGAQKPPGVGEEPLVHVALDHFALDLQAVAGDFQQGVEAGVQAFFVAGVQVTQARAVDGHHAEGAGLFRGAEQTVAALEEFAQVELQPATHGTHHVGRELGVDEVLEVGEPVAGGHGEQPVRVFAVPGEVVGDVVGRDGEGEDAALGVPRRHHFDVGAVDEVHFGLELAVGEGLLHAADDRDLVAQVFRTDPIEGEVGEGGVSGNEGLAAAARNEGAVASGRAPDLACVSAALNDLDVGLAVADDVEHMDAGVRSRVDGAAVACQDTKLLKRVQIFPVVGVDADATVRLDTAVAPNVGVQEKPDLANRKGADQRRHALSRRVAQHKLAAFRIEPIAANRVIGVGSGPQLFVPAQSQPCQDLLDDGGVFVIAGGLPEAYAAATGVEVEISLGYDPGQELYQVVVHLMDGGGFPGVGHDDQRLQLDDLFDVFEYPTVVAVEQLTHHLVPGRDPLLLGAVAQHVHFAVEVVGGYRQRLQIFQPVITPVDRRDLLPLEDPVMALPAVFRQAFRFLIDALTTPPGRHVEVVDEFLNGLPDLLVAQAILPYKGGHAGIEAGEGLGPGPFVLQGAEEVDDLAHGGGHVPGRVGLHLAGDPVQSLVQEGAQGPAGAVSGEHVEVVDVEVPFPVGGADLGRVDVGEPVVGDHLAGAVEDQPAQGVALVGVGGDPPVGAVEVFVDGGGHIHQGAAVLAQPGVLLAVDDVGAGGLEVIGGDQGLLHHVLDAFDVGDTPRIQAVADDLDDLGGEPGGLEGSEFAARLTGAQDGGFDLAGIEGDFSAVAFAHAGRQGREMGQCIGHDPSGSWRLHLNLASSLRHGVTTHSGLRDCLFRQFL